MPRDLTAEQVADMLGLLKSCNEKLNRARATEPRARVPREVQKAHGHGIIGLC